MIEISLGKLVMLALIALIVLGPEKLPGAARTAGALLRRVRHGWDNVRAEVERELEIEQIKRTAREAAARAEAAQNELKEGVQKMREPFGTIAADVAAMSQPAPAVANRASGDDAVTDLPVDNMLSDPTVSDDMPSHNMVSDDMQAELPLGQPLLLTESPGTPHDNA